jgi:hypothetical protein
MLSRELPMSWGSAAVKAMRSLQISAYGVSKVNSTTESRWATKPRAKLSKLMTAHEEDYALDFCQRYYGGDSVRDCLELIFSSKNPTTLVCGLPAGEVHGDSDYHDGSEAQGDCVCGPGHTGSNNGPCCACGIGTYKPTLGSAPCTACPENYKTSIEGSVTKEACEFAQGFTRKDQAAPSCGPTPSPSQPPHPPPSPPPSPPPITTSPAPSPPGEAQGSGAKDEERAEEEERRKCDPGYTGADGGPCLPCHPGNYKAVTGDSACIKCPQHSVSDWGATECECAAGWWGYPRYNVEEDSEGIHFVGGPDPYIEKDKVAQEKGLSAAAELLQEADGEHLYICRATGVKNRPYQRILIEKSEVLKHEAESAGADIIPAPPEGCPGFLIMNWCKECRQDVTLEFEDPGTYFCPGGTRRYQCAAHARSGSNSQGVADSTPCECDFGWKHNAITAEKECNGPDDWGMYDPITKLPRIGCLDSVHKADHTKMKVPDSIKELVAPTNRFYGSTIFAPKGIGLSERGYLDVQEPDALCRSQSGQWRSNDPLIADKGRGCPDQCAYTACNLGQSFSVQCPDHCYTASGVVYGSVESEGIMGPYEDISSICRAAILSGAGDDEKPFYVTFTITEPRSEYQDPGGGRVVFDKWDRVDDPVKGKPPWVSEKCCKGGWPPRLGAAANAHLLYRKMYHHGWENVRAFRIEEVDEHTCPKGQFVQVELKDGHNYKECLPCPAGTYKDTWGSASCSDCPDGTTSTEGSIDCGGNGLVPDECAKGFYASHTGHCLPCPVHSESPPGEDDITDCVCKFGHTGRDGGPCSPCEAGTYKASTGSDKCKKCPEGSWSEEGASECFCQPGWWGHPRYEHSKFEHMWCRPCVQDAQGQESEVGLHYCPGGARRYPCLQYAHSGKNEWGVVDAAQCECDCGWKLGGSVKTQCNIPQCDDKDDWKKARGDASFNRHGMEHGPVMVHGAPAQDVRFSPK